MALVNRLLEGLLVWAVGFSVIYGVHGLGCGFGWGDRLIVGPFTPLNMVLVPVWIVFVLMALWALRRATRAGEGSEEPAMLRAGMIGGWAGLVGLVVTGAPVLLPAHCL